MLNFMIESLRVSGPGKIDGFIKFSDGLNVIQGRSNTGKTWILKCIYYLFSSDTRPYSPLTGYTDIEGVFQTKRYGRITMTRKLDEEKVTVVAESEEVENGEYDTNYKRISTRYLNDLWLRIIGLDETIEVPKSARYARERMSWANVANVFYADENEIDKAESIVIKDPRYETPLIASLYFLLSGDYKKGIPEITKPEVATAKKKAVIDYIDEQRDYYGDITKIPLTNTGRVRREVKKNCFRKVTDPKTHKKHIPYKNLMNRLTLGVREYGYAKQAFLGGYTHANARYSKKLLADVHSIDFTSSYPTVMISEKYPMSKGAYIKLDMDSYAEFDDYLNQCERVAVVMVELWDIETKPDIPDDYIPCSRLMTPKGKQIMNNNGRVHKADYVKLIVTSVDLAQIVSCYNYSKIHIIDGYFYYVDYLPKEIIECILEFYEKKTTLKGVKGMEAEYLLKKGMLNSCYGMCVTDLVSDGEQCTYNKGWEYIKPDVAECVDQYNNNPNRFLFYVWGVFVTAYARNNLFNGINSIGRDYVYCDTDSIKFLNMAAHKAYIEDYNSSIIRKCTECLEHWDLDPVMLAPKNKKGEVKQIGIWDYEGKYDHFKTNGCKRYLTEIGGEFDLTCAGLPENKGIAELTRNGTNVDDVFARFNDDFKVDAENSGKLAHFYNDDPFEIDVVDYLGNHGKISCNSCCVLFPVAFSVNGNEEYKLFLKYIAKLQG